MDGFFIKETTYFSTRNLFKPARKRLYAYTYNKSEKHEGPSEAGIAFIFLVASIKKLFFDRRLNDIPCR